MLKKESEILIRSIYFCLISIHTFFWMFGEHFFPQYFQNWLLFNNMLQTLIQYSVIYYITRTGNSKCTAECSEKIPFYYSLTFRLILHLILTISTYYGLGPFSAGIENNIMRTYYLCLNSHTLIYNVGYLLYYVTSIILLWFRGQPDNEEDVKLQKESFRLYFMILFYLFFVLQKNCNFIYILIL